MQSLGGLRVGFGKLELYLLCTEHLAIYYVQQSQPLSTDPLHIATMYRSTTYSHYVQSQPAATFNHLVMQAGRTLQSPSSTHTLPIHCQYWQHTACQYCQYWQHTANAKCQLATLMHWIISHTGWHTSTLTLGAFNGDCKGRRFALQHVSRFASNCALLIQDLGI